jgi:ribosomal protein S19
MKGNFAAKIEKRPKAAQTASRKTRDWLRRSLLIPQFSGISRQCTNNNKGQSFM